MGKLIVIEGTDSSGKETQTKKLFERLLAEKYNVKKISFPNYDSPACEPVKMYLAGKFGEDAMKVNPYPISMMYAIDRYASYKMDWEKFYKEEGIIVTDRYVTSNMVHQASKIIDENKKSIYLDWLDELEYDKMDIPRPDLIIFLNMPTKMALKLMEERNNKITGEQKKDIHERNMNFLMQCREAALYSAEKLGWNVISCADNGTMKSIEAIHKEIMDKLTI